MQSPQAVYTAAGTPGTKGTCSVCGTKMFRMGHTPAHQNLPKPAPAPKAKRAATKKSRPKANSRKPKGKLVIVESPAKARTIGKFLGRGYTVKASVGHVRDLLRSQLSVDVENGFAPKYRVPNEKRPLVKELTKDVAAAAEVYLATDADREGEAIAWHLMEATDMDAGRVRRVVFHEITREAIEHAFANHRDLNLNRVNAQQARRILDRLVGYKISPLLWQRVRSRTSAGRVQSVALRLICEREEAIADFTPQEYWTLDARLARQSPPAPAAGQEFTAQLVKIKGKKAAIATEAEAQTVVAGLKTQTYRVTGVKRGQRRRKSPAPFITSTLQQEASRRLGFGTRRTMRLAQQLYEGVELAGGETAGLITYMRTDSTNVAAQAQAEARALIVERYGPEFVPPKPPQHKTRSRRAQEAHEAIRPTDVRRLPAALKSALSAEQYRLYNLIWLRFIASQMTEALYQTMRVDITAGPYSLRASGSRLKFAGFLSVYEETAEEDAAPQEGAGITLPDLAEGEIVDLLNVLPEQHFTQPPPRYTEASLVKTLEEFGIGRPST
ncbi:MAG: type I DNA topoisomerase, partial [Anaerolineae bacterium]